MGPFDKSMQFDLQIVQIYGSITHLHMMTIACDVILGRAVINKFDVKYCFLCLISYQFFIYHYKSHHLAGGQCSGVCNCHHRPQCSNISETAGPIKAKLHVENPYEGVCIGKWSRSHDQVGHHGYK